jgi:hypothetical protein
MLIKYIIYNVHVNISSFLKISLLTQLFVIGVTSGAGTAYPSGALEFTPGF